MVGVGVAPPVRSLQRHTEADDAWHVLCAASPALLLAATFLLKLEQRSPAYVEQADTFGSVELVSRQREQIDAESVDVQWQGAGRLHGVGMKRNAAVAGNRGNVLERLNRTRLIVRVHDGDQARLWPHRGGDCPGIDDAPAIRRHIRRGEPLLLQGLRRVQHRVVLDGSGDDVRHRVTLREREPGTPSDTTQCEVIALGRATGEDDLTWLTPENANARSARLVYRRPRLLP